MKNEQPYEVQLDWKFISKTPGYRSLKKAYIQGKQSQSKWDREYAEKAFRNAISYAKRHSARTGKPLYQVIFDFEVLRGHHSIHAFYNSYFPVKVTEADLYKTPRRYKKHVGRKPRTKNRWLLQRKKLRACIRKRSL